MSDISVRLRTVAAKALEMGQEKTARELFALSNRIAAQFYFLVDPGGFGDIPDNEYVEFEDKKSVVEYVRDKILTDDWESDPVERAKAKKYMHFEESKKLLMSIGEFGELASPLTPPNTMIGAGPDLSLEGLIKQLKNIAQNGKMEIVGGIEIDVDKATMLLEFLASVNPAFATAAMAMGMANLLSKAYSWITGKTASSEEAEEILEEYVPEDLSKSLVKKFQEMKSDPLFVKILHTVIRVVPYDTRAEALSDIVEGAIQITKEIYNKYSRAPKGTEVESFVKKEAAFYKEIPLMWMDSEEGLDI